MPETAPLLLRMRGYGFLSHLVHSELPMYLDHPWKKSRSLFTKYFLVTEIRESHETET